MYLIFDLHATNDKNTAYLLRADWKFCQFNLSQKTRVDAKVASVPWAYGCFNIKSHTSLMADVLSSTFIETWCIW